MARVQRRRQPLDRAALAGGVPALEDDGQRRPDLAVADQPAQRQPQLRRFKRRETEPLKTWKLTDEDWRNREKRSAYEQAVEDMLERTDHPLAR
ncbi:MAG TPA: hypothetical protein VHH14_05100, partial [Solirubrobacterales bacterium]|nr:hypothetical protein [Solirubrobacterales bacterium]